MELSNYQLVRVAMRMREAAGYYELGMLEHALACLDSVDRMGELGAFRLVLEMFRAQILKHPASCDRAAKALEELAAKLPPAYSRSLWLALSMCYRQAGDQGRAASSLGYARGAKPEGTPLDE